MPARHIIDDESQIIVTTWEGDTVEKDFIDALTTYLAEIKSQSRYLHYSELLDFRNLDLAHLSGNGIRQLAEIAACHDPKHVKTRLAIVVNSLLALGLARMYQTYRSLVAKNSKDLHIFRDINEAEEWLKQAQASKIA